MKEITRLPLAVPIPLVKLYRLTSTASTVLCRKFSYLCHFASQLVISAVFKSIKLPQASSINQTSTLGHHGKWAHLLVDSILEITEETTDNSSAIGLSMIAFHQSLFGIVVTMDLWYPILRSNVTCKAANSHSPSMFLCSKVQYWERAETDIERTNVPILPVSGHESPQGTFRTYQLRGINHSHALCTVYDIILKVDESTHVCIVRYLGLC